MGDALKSTVMEVSDTSATAASDLHESPPAPTAAPGMSTSSLASCCPILLCALNVFFFY